ncbi:hypothetical protein B296_00021797 [Ensete ventricosum]|uniref:Uncharacterized protein n=1 Tax=Ensete ventricosum TaxID=4639 RepID=A0A426YLP9_ENSVE|nr:hypothetical protein B296_00021797 [Ensete ventricosum]
MAQPRCGWLESDTTLSRSRGVTCSPAPRFSQIALLRVHLAGSGEARDPARAKALRIGFDCPHHRCLLFPPPNVAFSRVRRTKKVHVRPHRAVMGSPARENWID